MADVKKEMLREKMARAFGELVARVKASADGVPNPSYLFAILRAANLNENNAVSDRLAREQLFRENPAAELEPFAMCPVNRVTGVGIVSGRGGLCVQTVGAGGIGTGLIRSRANITPFGAHLQTDVVQERQ